LVISKKGDVSRVGNFVHGKNSFVAINFDIFTGVGTDISQYLIKVDLARNSKNSDTSTFGSQDESYIAGLKGADLSFDGLYDSNLDDVLSLIWESVSRQTVFAYGPVGNSSGHPYQTGTCILSEYNIDGEIGSPVKFTAKFKITGSLARSNF
jgi:hypothetical protein